MFVVLIIKNIQIIKKDNEEQHEQMIIKNNSNKLL